MRQIVSCSGSCRRTLCKLPCNVIDLGHKKLQKFYKAIYFKAKKLGDQG